MTIQIPVNIGDFGLDFAKNFRFLVNAVNRIFANGELRAPTYTVATLPDASVVSAGSIVYVSDASGTPCIAFSDGSVWKRCDDASVTVT